MSKKETETKSLKYESAMNALKIRQERRHNAIHAIEMAKLVEQLGLGSASGVICPFCHASGLEIDSEKHEFRCPSCKKKGTSLKLVKGCLGGTDWDAIRYIEYLVGQASNSSTASLSAPVSVPVSSDASALPTSEALAASGKDSESVSGEDTAKVSTKEWSKETTGISETAVLPLPAYPPEARQEILPSDSPESKETAKEKNSISVSHCESSASEQEKAFASYVRRIEKPCNVDEILSRKQTVKEENHLPGLSANPQEADGTESAISDLSGNPQEENKTANPQEAEGTAKEENSHSFLSANPQDAKEMAVLRDSANPREEKDTAKEENSDSARDCFLEMPASRQERSAISHTLSGLEQEQAFAEYVKRVKSQHRIEDLIEREAGVRFKKVGSSLVCRCPFPDHRDNTPSFYVSSEKQLFHCFGCGRGGDAFSFLMLYRGCKFLDALRVLSGEELPAELRRGSGGYSHQLPDLRFSLEQAVSSANSEIPASAETLANPANSANQSNPGSQVNPANFANQSNPGSQVNPANFANQSGSIIVPKARQIRLITRLRDFFHARIGESPAVREFLEHRGLLSRELVEYFRIGFDDGSVNAALSSDIIPDLQALGLLNGKNHSSFYQCVTLGLEDIEGNVVSLYGRRIPHRAGSNASDSGNAESPAAQDSTTDCSSLSLSAGQNAGKGLALPLSAGQSDGKPLVSSSGKGSKHQFPRSKIEGIFHLAAFLACREIILTEGILDSLAVFLMGFRNTSCLFSAASVPQLLLEAMARYNMQKIFLTLDNDAAGLAACVRVARALREYDGGRIADLPLMYVQLPNGVKDANQLLMDYGKDRASEMLQRMIAEARPYSLDDVGRKSSSLAVFSGAKISSGTELCTGTGTDSSLAVPSGTKTSSGTELCSGTGTGTDSSLAVPSGTKTSSGTEVSSCTLHSGTDSSSKEKGQGEIVVASQDMVVRIKGEDVEIEIAERKYRVRGLEKNLAYDVLKVNIRVSNRFGQYFIDTLDLYNARYRLAFVKAASEAVEARAKEIEQDLGKVLGKLEELQERKILQSVKPEKKEYVMSEKERQEAMELLQSPNLLERIVSDFRKCGLVGEEVNIQFGYLCCLSRKHDDPLAVIIQSASAAGKSSLMEALLMFIPPEDKTKYTALTGQSLFYMEENELVHKTLAIEEEKGAQEATYAIKIMQSEKELCIASTGNDPKTGRHVTHEYRVKGPAQTLFSTSSAEIDEELQNRGIVLTVNENREQTQAIHERQREKETLEGILEGKESDHIVRVHQNAQRLIRNVTVVNPFAKYLTFLNSQLRTRRDHRKYLILIRTIALLHQHQRVMKHAEKNGQTIKYIEVTLQDIEITNKLANEVMGTSLDELSPQTRRTLDAIYAMVQQKCEKQGSEQNKVWFTRKEVRDFMGCGDTQPKVHIARLVDLEYMAIRHTNRSQQYLYELIYKGEGKEGKRFVMGLMDTETLRKKMAQDEEKRPG